MTNKFGVKWTFLRQQVASVVADPFIGIISKSRLSPNMLTVIGLAVSFGAAGVIATERLLVGGVLVLVAGLFDMLDGALARSIGRETKLGGLVDSVSDRLAEAVLFTALLVVYTSRGSLVGVLLTIAALVGSFLTSYIRARAEGLGLDCRVGLFTRGERVLVLAIGLMLNQALIAVGVITILGWVTVAQRIFHAWRQMRGQ